MRQGVRAVVEGSVDQAVLERITELVGLSIEACYVAEGKSEVRRRMAGYNNAARFSCWVVLVDLDREERCAPSLVASWLPRPAQRISFRVAVRAAEAWILADRESIAEFLHVPISAVPDNVEALDDPKRAVVDLAVRSRRRAIRRDMVPRPGSGRAVGPGYSTRLHEFVSGGQPGWRPEVARTRSASLDRCLRDLEARRRSC